MASAMDEEEAQKPRVGRERGIPPHSFSDAVLEPFL